jgi:predicted RecB family endonuclease
MPYFKPFILITMEDLQGTSKRVVLKRIKIPVTAANTLIEQQITLENKVTRVIGITATSTDDDAITTLTQRLEINGLEVFPQDTETKIIFCYPSVESGKRFYALNEPAGNKVVKISVKDENAGSFTAYTANFTLQLEKEI